MSLWISIALFSACSDEKLQPTDKSVPDVKITSHADQVTTFEGAVQTLTAKVSDEDHSMSELQVTWSVDTRVVCDSIVPTNNGVSSCEIPFQMEDSKVTVEVIDPDGLSTSTFIPVNVEPSFAPVVSILSPSEGGQFYSDVSIQFIAELSDAEDPNEDLKVEWRSDILGTLNLDSQEIDSERVTASGFLSEGEHTLSIYVEDTMGKMTTEEVAVSVGGANQLPLCSINSPGDGIGVTEGTIVSFQGLAEDVDIDNSLLQIEWSSSIDGVLNTVGPTPEGTLAFDTELSFGSHTVNLVVLDEVGGLCETSTTLNVGQVPTVQILLPAESEVLTFGETFVFAGPVSDDVDVNALVSFEWFSSVDGLIGSGRVDSNGLATAQVSNLSGGAHTITLTATDSIGLSASTTHEVYVNQAPIITGTEITSISGMYNDSTLNCSTSTFDIDQAVEPSFVWTVNGATVAGETIDLSTVSALPGDLVQCEAAVIDDHGLSASEVVGVVLENRAPIIQSTAISSNIVYRDSELDCTVQAVEPDGETLTTTIDWLVNGVSIGTGSSLALQNVSVDAISVGDSIVCTVTSTDEVGSSVSDATAVATLANSTPFIVGTPTIDNMSPEIGETVECFSVAEDLDEDILTKTVEWFDATTGSLLGNDSTLLVENLSVGSEFYCEVSVDDGFVSGVSVQSSTAMVQNTNPLIESVTITGADPIVNDSVLVCEAVFSDINDSNLTVDYLWEASNGWNEVGSTVALNNTLVQPSDTLTCTVTVQDSNEGSATLASSSVTIANREPTIDTPTLSPSTDIEIGTSIYCSASVTDLDGGSLVESYEWTTVNGDILSSTDLYAINASEVSVGDEIICTVSVIDSTGATVSNTVSTTIQNTEPTIGNVEIVGSTTNFYNDEELMCSVTVTDPNQTPTLSFAWILNGFGIGNQESLNLNTSSVDAGDTVVCQISIDDADGFTTTVQGSVLIGNRAPSEPTVSIGWTSGGNAPLEDDDLTCTATDSQDPDRQTVIYAYTWSSSDGRSSTGAILTADNLVGGETWTCAALATDGALNSAIVLDSVEIPVFVQCGSTACDENIDLGGGVSIDWVRISAGNDPLNRYTLTNDFLLMTTEVTQSMFSAVMNYNYDVDNTAYSADYGQGPDHPAGFMDWHMAADFTNHLTDVYNSQMGLALEHCYSCTNTGTTSVICSQIGNPYQCEGFRLPTEAEWEYAARSGTQWDFWTSDGGGDSVTAGSCNLNVTDIADNGANPSVSEYGWFCGNSNYTYHTVATLEPNGNDVYDMHGNVAEWMDDDLTCSLFNYPTTTDPYCHIGNARRVLRGGSFNTNSALLENSTRWDHNATTSNVQFGFRVAFIEPTLSQ